MSAVVGIWTFGHPSPIEPSILMLLALLGLWGRRSRSGGTRRASGCMNYYLQSQRIKRHCWLVAPVGIDANSAPQPNRIALGIPPAASVIVPKVVVVQPTNHI